MTNHVIQLEPHHVSSAAGALADAFAPEPLYRWLLPDDKTRERRLRFTFELVVRYGMRFGAVLGDVNADSVAVWLPSKLAAPSLWQEIRFGGLRILASHGPAAVWRTLRTTDHMARVRQQLVPDSHEYLWALGVRRGRQGAGLGSRLLGARLPALDAQQSVAYLETHQPRNVPLYKRFGFVVERQHDLPHAALTQWSMVRPPR